MTNFGFRDESLNARNAFAPTARRRAVPARSGSTSTARSSRARRRSRCRLRRQQLLRLADDQREDARREHLGAGRRPPTDRMFGSVRVEHALTETAADASKSSATDERARATSASATSTCRSRAYTSDDDETAVRFSLNGLARAEGRPRAEGPFSRRTTATATRCRPTRRSSCSTRSPPAAPARRATARRKTLEVADNIDCSFGKKHAFRAGLLCES